MIGLDICKQRRNAVIAIEHNALRLHQYGLHMYECKLGVVHPPTI